MSSWSSSTGRAQLSYADRLRQASKSAAPSRQDPSPSASTKRAASQESSKIDTNATSLNVSSAQTDRRLSSSTASAATAVASAPKPSSSAVALEEGSTSSQTVATPQKSTGPPVNVWEARRKQLAEREAEKERERQAIQVQQQKKAPPASTSMTPATNTANVVTSRTKQASASTSTSGSRKGNERQPKGSANPGSSDRKSSKQANQTSARTSSSVPIPPPTKTAAQFSDGDNAPAAISRDNNAASTSKSAKNNGPDVDEARAANNPQSSGNNTVQPTFSEQADAATKVQKVTSEQKDAASVVTAVEGERAEESGSTSSAAQSAAAQVAPSTALVNPNPPNPAALQEDIPASPATVASAIEEVLKNGVAGGAQTEDDDAWLARIHLLNGGQNMPKYSGFAPNGASALSDEAETQAAKKAERAVAAAWGAGKSVWNKSQQQHQQHGQGTDVSTSPAAVTADPETATASVDVSKHGNARQTSKANADAAGSTPAPVSVNGTAAGRGQDSLATASTSLNAANAGKPDNASGNVSSQKKADEDKLPKTAKQHSTGNGAASQPKSPAAGVPPFEDVNNWPSPLDAGKRLSEKPKLPISNSENDKSDSGKSAQPKGQKGFYETLDELQVRLAPGAGPQQQGNASGTRKGKQQWVSILPEITHASTSTSASGANSSRPAADGRTGKGASKQSRKEGNKGVSQTQAAQGAKKEGGNKAATKAVRSEDKLQGKDTGSEGAEARVPHGQRASEDEQHGTTLRQDGVGRLRSSPTATGMAGSAPTEFQPQNTGSQLQEATPTDQAITPTTSHPAPTSSIEQTNADRGESSGKAPRAARSHLRPAPNGISQPSPLYPSVHANGIVRPGQSGASSGAATPMTHRSSPRGSATSSPQVHPLPRAGPLPADAFVPGQPAPMFYSPSGAATPMLAGVPPAGAAPGSAPWVAYDPYARPPPQVGYMFEATAQTGAPVPAGVLGQLLGQIEFYFSQHNLQGDFFLRQKMDALGWVDIGVLAGFKRVQAITRDVGMVKDALLYSVVLDVDEGGMKVRRRFGWELYTLAPSVQPGTSARAQRDADDEPPLGIVAASGLGGTLDHST